MSIPPGMPATGADGVTGSGSISDRLLGNRDGQKSEQPIPCPMQGVNYTLEEDEFGRHSVETIQYRPGAAHRFESPQVL